MPQCDGLGTAGPLMFRHMCSIVKSLVGQGADARASLLCGAALLAAAACAALLLVVTPSTLQGGTIYYFEDKNGVMHFTDMPDIDQYKPFLTFGPENTTDRQEIIALVRKYSQRYSLDPKLVQAVLAVESNYDPHAVSEKGAEGLMQIMPETQKDLGLYTPYDPEANIEAGVRYLKKMIDTQPSLELALAAYNAGPARVRQYQGVPPFPETRRYIKKVLRLYNISRQ